MTNQEINEGLLSFIHEQTGRGVIYEQEPIPLLGGIDATTYKFKLRGMEPMVLRLLGSDRGAEEVKRLQIHSQVLIQSNIKAPKVHWVGEDKSALGGVFAIMEFFPDPLLSEQPGDIQLKILGKSHAEMHNLSTTQIINELKKQGLNEKDFMACLFMPTILDSALKDHPWLSNIINWLQNNLPINSAHASINHSDYHPKNIMYASGHITGIIDWNFFIGDPAFDVGHTITLIMDIVPNISDDYTHEIVSQNNEQYRDAYQSIRSIDEKAVNACRVCHCTGFLLHCLSGKKDIITSSPTMLQSLKTTIETITKLEIALPNS
ncbi:aminoglycoside phosphotransferase family protein [Synechococcus sp. UW179B]|uniref:aminoglycoside phosphotransferase family protein n=1 Tax=Synechococcus sp. UW179B TaxID=2575516 RepID=UPI000E0FE9B5|nr:aminoglycoside phosphotransferase family protein [Synechococcus sp. UW179B]